jgi:hypothetical protein
VLAMLEGLKGDAGEVTRLATPSPADPPAIPISPNARVRQFVGLRVGSPAPSLQVAGLRCPEPPGIL